MSRARGRPGAKSGARSRGRGPAGSIRRLPVLVGPTASGKTAVSLMIADSLPVEIISADSRQVYARMDIGTAKPDREQLGKVPHHFIGTVAPDEAFNAGIFSASGRRVVGEIVRRGHVPLVVGGSGLYVRALVDGIIDAPGRDQALRGRLESRLREEGAGALLRELGRRDPERAAAINPSQTRRLVRAMEIVELTGSTPTELRATVARPPFEPVMAGIRWPRETLYRRIDERVVHMVNAGLIDEARRLLEMGYRPGLQSLKTVGYAEAFEYLSGGLSLGEMIAVIRMNTRRFAKRQLTWFRADSRIRWFDIREEPELPAVAHAIVDHFQRR